MEVNERTGWTMDSLKLMTGWWPVLVIYFLQRCSAVWVDEQGGYRDLLVAVDSSTKIKGCQDFFKRIEELTTLFSRDLWRATEKRLHVASVDVLLDDVMAAYCGVTTAGTRQKWTNADIRLADGGANIGIGNWHSDERSAITVHQPLGCGKPGDAIKIDSSLLSLFEGSGTQEVRKTNTTEVKGENRRPQILEEMGQTLVTSWARYRWGIFEEFPVGAERPLGTPHEDSKKAMKGSQVKRCGNSKRDCKSLIPTEELTGTDLNFSQPTVSPQELLCGKKVLDVVDSHPDLSWTFKVKKNFELPLPLTTIFPQDPKPTSLSPTLNNSSPTLKNFHYLSTVASSKDTHETRNHSSLYSTKRERYPEEGNHVVKKRKARSVEYPKEETLTESNDVTGLPARSFIGTLPPADDSPTSNEVVTELELLFSFGSRRVDPVGTFSALSNQTSEVPPSISWPSFVSPPSISGSSPSSSSSSSSNHSVTWVWSNEAEAENQDSLSSRAPTSSQSLSNIGGFRPPHIAFIASPRKALVIALDLSGPSVSQASVEWLRGGLLRWMFGVGDGVLVGILASYSNTSFPLSLGPLAPGPSSGRQLKEHMALLPYQHEVDDDVYGGLYCAGCAVKEAEKMLVDSGIPMEAGVLVLAVCEPRFTSAQMRVALNSPIHIHTLTMCPNAPLTVEGLAANQGSWSLSHTSMESGFAADVQIGQLITKISEETLLWPKDKRLQTVYEEDKMLREDDVERVGAYRRVRGTIILEVGRSPRLVIITSSSPAKVVELWAGERRIEMNRDTTRRHWALVSGHENKLAYSLKYLSTSLELPLTVEVGTYESREEVGLKIRLRTNTRHYRPMNPTAPYLKVWAEVTKSGRTVRDADVTLSVTYLSGGTPSTYSLMLLDDGSTEPDITAGDAIYSRYLTWTPGTGRYILTATATNNPNTVSEWIEDGELKSSRTGHFSSMSPSISVVVEMIVPGDIFPPSRITDLTVTSLGKSLVNISWSAPGGDLDQGSAWRYDLKMYTESDALNEANFDSTGIDVYCIHDEEQAPMPAPALFRTPQFCVTSIPFSNLKWYFAIRAVDGANNTGRISNIVSAHVSEPTTTISSDPNSFKDDVQKVMMSTVMPDEEPSFTEDDYDSWRVYGAALVGAVSLVMLAIASFACFICCRKARIRASKNPERPIYKIYVNNAYIQEEDGEIKVVSKEKALNEKDSTQQWVNSLDKYSSADPHPREKNTDTSGDAPESSHPSSSKFPKPVRFGVLTNGSIMREIATPSSSSSSSKPSDDATGDDFKYKDLSETISNSTTDGATASTSSAGTEISTADPIPAMKEPSPRPPSLKTPQSLTFGYDMSYPPLGIPTLPGPTVIPTRYSTKRHEDYHSDEEGGFRPRFVPSPGSTKHLLPHFSSFRYLPPPPDVADTQQYPVDYQPTINAISKTVTTALSHGTVRSVKKRRHISFV